MPSPFPGMDPYLEADLWTSVHAQLGSEIARQLAPKLRPRYVALAVERFVLDQPDEVSIETTSLYPDVGTVTTGSTPGVPHISIEIRDTKNRRLVTAIEILSPTNKKGRGRRQYLAKRRRLLMSTSHLMEIDLVRVGQRVPIPLPPAPYFVLLGRVESQSILEVWPISLREQLPVVPVPLLPGDSDVSLDLQLALTNIYDLCGYDLLVDYTEEAEPPLAPDDRAWADEMLRGAGKRP